MEEKPATVLSKDYQPFLVAALSTPKAAVGYLIACLEVGEDTFLIGLKDVAEAFGYIKKE